MGVRSFKQQRASFNRIVIETKSIKQAQKLIREQYTQLGRKVPKKIENETASMRDVERYMQTLRNAYDRKVYKEELKRDGNSIQKKLNQLNRLHAQRKVAISNQLSGYSPDFVNNIASGREVVIGYNMTYSMVSTEERSLERMKEVAEFNNKPVGKMLDSEIKAMKQDLQQLKSLTVDKEHLLQEFVNVMEENGFVVSNKNMETVRRNLEGMDFLGEEKVKRYIWTKHQNTVYKTYLKELSENDNEKLMLSFISDIKQSKRMAIESRARFIT